MKKTFLFACLATIMSARAAETPDSLQEVEVNETYLQRMSPSETRDYVQLGKWYQHWFLGVQAGGAAFLGTPVGCGDFFDRITCNYNAYLGKWITPSIGIRAAAQGFRFYDNDLVLQKYQAYHADVMYNLSNLFRSPSSDIPRWDFVPYVGVGLARGTDYMGGEYGNVHNNQFALAYGIQSRVRLGRNFHITGEVSGFTTFRQFDLAGEPGKLGDHMVSASLGFGFTLGNPRWRHAIDANPYISQCDYLLGYIDRLEQSNRALRNRYNYDRKTLEELKKILELEGLLDKYGYLFDEENNGKNSYKGLMSLRSRLKGFGGYYNPENPDAISIPIYFFFKIGKAQLTDNSQMINIDELAKLAIAYNLKLEIVGAADKATGNKTFNEQLSRDRVQYIAKLLKDRNVPVENMHGTAMGGIDEFQIPKDNRYSKVVIYLEFGKKVTDQ